MQLQVKVEAAPIRIDDTGTAYVGSTRVPIDTVIDEFNEGASAEEIIQYFPALALVDVYGVIAYYLREKPEVDSYLEQRRRNAERIRQENEARFNPVGLREKLLARRKTQE